MSIKKSVNLLVGSILFFNMPGFTNLYFRNETGQDAVVEVNSDFRTDLDNAETENRINLKSNQSGSIKFSILDESQVNNIIKNKPGIWLLQLKINSRLEDGSTVNCVFRLFSLSEIDQLKKKITIIRKNGCE